MVGESALHHAPPDHKLTISSSCFPSLFYLHYNLKGSFGFRWTSTLSARHTSTAWKWAKQTDIFIIMEINLDAQSKSTWRDFMHLAFFTKHSFSFLWEAFENLFFSLFRNLNVILLGYYEGLTSSSCCIVILLTHYPTTISGSLKEAFESPRFVWIFIFYHIASYLQQVTAGWSFRAEHTTGDPAKRFYAPAAVLVLFSFIYLFFTTSAYLSWFLSAEEAGPQRRNRLR